MKFLIAVCIAFLTVIYAKEDIKQPPALAAKSKKYVEECRNEQKITIDAVAALKMGDFSNKSNNVQCFVNCFIQKHGFFVDGIIKEDALLEIWAPVVGLEKLKDVMKKCNGLKGANNCETALKLHECYYKENAVAL